jgi:DNA polymerase-3 subunit alpha
MLLSRLLADFTRGESDALRKAMGKKLKDKLDHMKPKFIAGGQKNGHDPKVLEKIWADWEKFASYAFNKSHATCYSWVAYQTAYLKANYPAEYMAATMSRNSSNINEITKLMDECKANGVSTLGPDVNESMLRFAVNHLGDIRFGLGAVKGVGEGAVMSILNEREANGPYKNIFDFVQRVNLSACNRKNIEALALAGAFDSMGGIKREDFFAKNAKDETFADVLVRYGNKYQADKAAAMNSLFGGDNAVEVATPEIPNAPAWSDLDRLNKERDLVGIYLSAHPLDEYRVVLENVCNTRMTDLANLPDLVNRDLTMGGIVTDVREGYTKTGKPYGVAKVEDYSGSSEFAFIGQEWVEKRNYFMKGMFLYMKGRCQPRQWKQDQLEVKVNSIELLPDVKDSLIQKITVVVPLSHLDEELIEDFSALLDGNTGPTELHFYIQDEDGQLYVNLAARKRKITVRKELISYIKERSSLSYKIN